jgi:hypothetical protein
LISKDPLDGRDITEAAKRIIDGFGEDEFVKGGYVDGNY